MTKEQYMTQLKKYLRRLPKLFIRGIIAIPFSASGSFIILGIGLFGIGLSILFCILGIYLCKWTCILFAKMAQLLIRRRRG